MKCGFCRDVRLFFTLLSLHTKVFLKEFQSYKNVCDVSSKIPVDSSFHTVSILPEVQKIRDQAQQNFDLSKIDPKEKI